MSQAISIRRDYSADELIARAARIEDPEHSRRLMAMAAILKGASREEAARIGGIGRRMLRDWVQRFNEHGPHGLLRRKSPGRPPKLTAEQRKELMTHVCEAMDSGGIPDLRLSDVAALVNRLFGVDLDEVSISRILREHGLRYNGSAWTSQEIQRPLVIWNKTQDGDEIDSHTARSL